MPSTQRLRAGLASQGNGLAMTVADTSVDVCAESAVAIGKLCKAIGAFDPAEYKRRIRKGVPGYSLYFLRHLFYHALSIPPFVLCLLTHM